MDPDKDYDLLILYCFLVFVCDVVMLATGSIVLGLCYVSEDHRRTSDSILAVPQIKISGIR